MTGASVHPGATHVTVLTGWCDLPGKGRTAPSSLKHDLSASSIETRLMDRRCLIPHCPMGACRRPGRVRRRHTCSTAGSWLKAC